MSVLFGRSRFINQSYDWCCLRAFSPSVFSFSRFDDSDDRLLEMTSESVCLCRISGIMQKKVEIS